MDPSKSALSRRPWVYLTVLAAGGVVALSWMVPEPPAPKQTPALPYEHVSYTKCAAEQFAPNNFAPSYGTRSVSYSCTD